MNRLTKSSNKIQENEVIFDEEDYDESDDVSIGSLFSSSDSDDNDDGFAKKTSEKEDVGSQNYVLIEYKQNPILQVKSSNIISQSKRNLTLNSRQTSFFSTQSSTVRKAPDLRCSTNEQNLMFKINKSQHPLRNKSTSYLLKPNPVIQGNIYRQNSNYFSIVKTSNNVVSVNENEYLIRNGNSQQKIKSPSRKIVVEYPKPKIIYSSPIERGTLGIFNKQIKTDIFSRPIYSPSPTKNSFEKSNKSNFGNIVIFKTPSNSTSVISKRLYGYSRNDKQITPNMLNTKSIEDPQINQLANKKNPIATLIKPENGEKKKIRVVTFLNDVEEKPPELNFTYENAEKKYLFPYINFGNNTQRILQVKNNSNLDQTKFLKIEPKNKVTPMELDLNLNSNSNYLLFKS
jgi:hypothetical protein